MHDVNEQNALKKQGGGGIMGGGGGGAEHIIYGADPGGHGGYQRSIIESPTDWVFTDEPPSTFSPIGAWTIETLQFDL